LADVGWRGGGGRYVGRTGEGARDQAARAICFVCHGWLQTGRDGPWSGVCDSEGFENGGIKAVGDRCHRTERGIRGAVARGYQRSRTGSRAGESERWGHCPGTSVGLYGPETDGQHYSRTETQECALWPGHDVRGRRHGRRGDLRKPELIFASFVVSIESTYVACLQFELADAGLRSDAQVGLPVVYRRVKLDLGCRMDLLVENLVIVEIKSVEAISLSIRPKSFRTLSSVANPLDCL